MHFIKLPLNGKELAEWKGHGIFTRFIWHHWLPVDEGIGRILDYLKEQGFR